MSNGMLCGLDLGGSKVIAGLFDETLHLVSSSRRDIPADIDADALVALLTALYESLIADVENPVVSIGIGVPAALTQEDGVMPACANLPGIETFPLASLLGERIGVRVYLENDANCFVLGEFLQGVGKGADCLVGLTLGTGIGMGIVIGGKLHRGLRNSAGEIWNLPMIDGPILEDGLAGADIACRVNAATAKEAAEQARRGSGRAVQAWQAFGKRLRWVVEMVGRVLDPDAFVLGGSIAASYDVWGNALEDTPWPIRTSRDPERSALLGAAYVATQMGRVCRKKSNI